MRPIFIAEMDKMRPVVLMTREMIAGRMQKITVAPITSTIRGLSTEVPVGAENGLDHDSVISCDSLTTVPIDCLRYQVGSLNPQQERQLTEAIKVAFDLY
jgi:mRNA interferase MazF